MTVVVERALSQHFSSVVRLFEAAEVPCFCQYFGFSGDHRAWQDRCANHRIENREGLLDDLSRPDFHALVAVRGEEVVGWCRLGSPGQLAKTYQNRLYRNLPCLDPLRNDVVALGCFLVRPDERRSGIARSLLRSAITAARASGATCIEAFPRGASDVTDCEQWTGPLAMYLDAGFRIIHDFAPYPIVRLDL